VLWNNIETMHFFCCIAVIFKILVANFTIFRHERLNVSFSFGAFKAIKKKLKEESNFQTLPTDQDQG